MGFAAGLQAGSSLAQDILDIYNQGKQRKEYERIQSAAPETVTEYTPAQAAQLKSFSESGGYDIVPQYAAPAEGQTQGLFTGYQVAPKAGLDLQGAEPAAPITIAPQQVSKFLGQTVQGELTPERMQGLRYSAMADAIAKQDPIRAMQMRQEVMRMDREAKEAPLRLQGLEQQVGLGKLQLTEAERKQAAAGRMDAFNTEFNTLENPSAEQVKALAAKHNLDRSQQLDVTSQITGIAKNELDAFDMDIKKAVKGKDLQGLIDLHKSDPRFGDGTHFVMAKGAKGQVILNLVSDADPTKVLRTESFSDSGMATAYLRKAAEDPANLAEWMVSMRGKETAIRASEADIDYKRAQAGALGTKGLEKKFSDMETILGRKLTENEKLTMFGAAPKPREVTSEAVANLAKEMVGKPSGRMVDGKPERYTMETATADARKFLSSGAGDTTAQPVNSLISIMRQNAPAAKQQATPAGQGLLNLADAYMPKPIPATPVTSSQERMRGLYLSNRTQQ